MNPIRLAKLNLMRRWVSSLIAVIAIGLSVGLSGTLYRLDLLLESRFAHISPSGQVLIGAKSGGIDIVLGALNSEGDFPQFIPSNLFETIKNKASVKFEDGSVQHPELLAVTPILYFAKASDFRIFGTDQTFFERPQGWAPVETSEGRSFQNDGEIVVGSQMADELGLHLNEKLRVISIFESSATKDLLVVGILKTTSTTLDRVAIANLKTAQEFFSEKELLEHGSIWGSKVIHYMMAYFSDMRTYPSFQSLINQRTVAQSIVVSRELERLKELTNNSRSLGLMIAFIVILLGALAVTAVLMTRFEAMNLQVAVLRALGYKKGDVFQWLGIESLILGGIACLFGVTLDLLLYPLVSEILASSLPQARFFDIKVWQSWPIWTAALFATLLSVLMPIWRSYRLDIHNALRS